MPKEIEVVKEERVAKTPNRAPKSRSNINDFEDAPKVDVVATIKIPEDYELIKPQFLPSEGLTYGAIYGRGLDLDDLSKWAKSNEDTEDRIIGEIVEKNTIVASGKKIFAMDKTSIALWLRAVTFPDPSYRISFECGKCKTNDTIHYTMDDIVINYSKEKVTAYTHTVVLPFSKHELVMRIPTIEDERTIEILYDKWMNDKPRFKDGVVFDYVIYSVLIDTIDGVEKTYDTKYKWLVKGLYPQDFAYLRHHVEKFNGSAEATVTTKCKECEASVIIPIMFSDEFTFPTFVAEYEKPASGTTEEPISDTIHEDRR